MSGETWLDLAHEVFPDKEKDELDFMLWEYTAFPFAEPDHIRAQLRVLKAMDGNKPLLRAYHDFSLLASEHDVAEDQGVTVKTARAWKRTVNQIMVAEGLRPITERQRVAS